MARGTILNLTRQEVVARWLADMLAVPIPPPGAPPDAGNRPVHYRLPFPNGGMDPNGPGCWDWAYGNRTPVADCIGFILHGAGIDRLQPGYKGTRGESLNCHSLYWDAFKEQRFVAVLKAPEPVKPGDWLLTEDHIAGILRPALDVTKLQPSEQTDPDYDHLVIDCSPRHGRQSGIGIGGPWSGECVVVRPLFYKDV